MSDSLRVAILAYRGNPHSGGQGVYTRYLARELTDLGHYVEVVNILTRRLQEQIG